MEDCIKNDDWFYESIRSYKTLQMYDIQMKPYHMVKLDDSSLCLVGIHPSGRTEVICIELPAKLMLPEEEGGRCKNNDFDIYSGGFLEEHVHCLGALPGGNKAVLSLKDTPGLSILDLRKDNSSVTKEKQIFVEEVVSAPNIAVSSSSPELLASKSAQDDLWCLDCTTNCATRLTMPTPLVSNRGSILSCYFEPDVAAVVNTNTGALLMLDLRSEDVTQLTEGDEKDAENVVTAYDNKIGILDTDGTIAIFDIRFANDFFARRQLDIPKCSSSNLKIQLASSGRISITGIDTSAYIYQIYADEIIDVFTHRGHSELDARPAGVVTDHLWLPHIAENLLVSCAENGTLNCWEYVQT